MNLDLSPEHLRDAVVTLITLILSICVHEFGHAFVADRLGDRLPRQQGRVTLNPLVHADPIGTIALPAICLLMGGMVGFGWGRPVQVNPPSFTRRFSMRTGHMMVAAAGPAMNVLFGITISLVTLILYRTGVISWDSPIYLPLLQAIIMNFVLAFFNLIPCPPLDGGAVIAGLLPRRLLASYESVAQYGMFILIAFFLIPQLRVIYVWPAMKVAMFWGGTVLGLPGL
jgi:Zn-dependent protease